MAQPDVVLRVDGAVERPTTFSLADLAGLDAAAQVWDVSRLDPKRRGDGVKLTALLDRVGVRADAMFIGLHSSTDDFHASIPLGPVRDRAILLYRHAGQPLDRKAGGPLRFFIPDYAACHVAEIDECANVKFVDRIELTVARGYDNRPADDEAHEELHQRSPQDG